MTPAERLRAAREASGHRSARVAAQSLGVTYSTYLSHENGSNAFTAEQAEAYAKAFGVTAPFLMFGDSGQASVARLVDILAARGIISHAEADMILGLDA
jgi:transcriptional regulator with XRE-family HTH domain